MKTRFNTFDIVCVVSELQKYVGMRVNNIYDIDNKTYLIRLQKTEEKAIILLESGNRIHSTAFEWPKNVAPSGFSMKMRKHLKNKRLECLTQLGTDRIIDLQFGSGEAAYHVILELYDRGNIILTDFELKILYILRPHTEGDKVRFAVKEVYPQNRAREAEALSKEKLLEILQKAKTGDQLKKVLVPNLDYGPAIIEHVLLKEGFSNNVKIGKTFDIEKDIDRVVRALAEAELIFASGTTGGTKGFITQKKEDRGTTDSNEPNFFLSNQEFHPMLFAQHANSPYLEFDTFNQAADEFFSAAESQKIELKGIQQEREAYKRLDKVKHDHSQRLVALEKTQEVDKQKAELISRNQELVDKAIMAVQSALASQLSWADIGDLVKNAAANGDPTAQSITNLKLETNHISISLTDPYASEYNSDNNSDEENDKIPPMTVDIDLGLTAFANARKYYDQKRFAAKKQQKTIDAQSKAFKSAEKKTKQALKEVQTITNINKARKVYWFEKFFWFISSENYLVIAGRDQQQNELIVKRYLRAKDIYVHADIHGASSVIIKNPSGEAVPPKTLNEAGTMAICYSVAWEAKVVTNAYWVWAEQVSKTAPTGEYLATGSFMVRGKKNFLPPSHLILGMSFLFKLEDGFIEKHKGERKVVTNLEEVVVEDDPKDEIEVEILDESDEEGHAEVKKDEKIEVETVAPGTEPKSDIKANFEDEETPKFPDTQVKIQHFGGTKMNILTESTLPNKDPENERIVYLGDNKPVTLNTAPRSRMNSETKHKQTKELTEKPDLKEDTSKQQAKRGQKGKLKKIKEKYKDQDDEERQLRMEILQSSGMGKEVKKSKKAKDVSKNKKTEPKIKREPRPKQATEETGGVDEDEPTVQAEVDMIDALTGIPSPEDELLFAVPVIAPYNTLANYKFKVKLTPGTGKRGKASKTALAMFLKDRTITPREKDLLKAVKDELLARNLPGKVKLSAPRLMALKK